MRKEGWRTLKHLRLELIRSPAPMTNMVINDETELKSLNYMFLFILAAFFIDESLQTATPLEGSTVFHWRNFLSLFLSLCKFPT